MKTTTEMQLVPVAKLVPYINNARTHSPEQISKLRSSLREFGFINPVIIDRDFANGEDTIEFPWLKNCETEDEKAAVTHFVNALIDMAKNQTRITAKEKEVENERYAFRCFLLRLGFIGNDYKVERKVLLRNLAGSAAFKTPKKSEVAE